MKKFEIVAARLFLLIITLGILSGCQNDPVTPDKMLESEAAAAITAVPTRPPEPANTPEPIQESAQISSAEEMVGIWLGTVAGEKGYVMYTDDGRYTVALVQDNLGSAPRVSGEYWFEDGNIYLRDLENAGHWAFCDSETVGIYEVHVGEDESLQFSTVEDGCDEGGFTRNYIFANMVQEWIGKPIALEQVEAGNSELADALQVIVDNYVAEGVPSAALMVDAPDMDFSWKGAAGMADPEVGLEMVAEDQFIISSISKMYTAVIMLKLVEQGLVNLDDSISQYLPEELLTRLLILDDESYGEAITIRQLLSHTSGLGDFSNGADEDGNGLPDFKDLVLAEPETIWTPDAVLEWAISNAPPVGKPGEGYNYSDTNYQLLGLIIEDVSGLSLAEAYRQQIFDPLGMEHTYFEFNEEAVPGVDGRSVSHAFYAGNDWNSLDSHSYEWGSGGLVSTLEDQNKFLRAWSNSEVFEDQAHKEAMLEWGDTPDEGVYYGLGTLRFVFDEWGIPGLGEVQGHGGVFNSQAFYWPDQNVTIIGTLNSNEPGFGFISMLIDTLSTVLEHAGVEES